jgi:hypothetical protein
MRNAVELAVIQSRTIVNSDLASSGGGAPLDTVVS